MKEIEENNRMGKTRDLFKKIRDTKGTFHAKTGPIKDRNGMDLTEADDIKKRWQEYTQSGIVLPLSSRVFGNVWGILVDTETGSTPSILVPWRARDTKHSVMCWTPSTTKSSSFRIAHRAHQVLFVEAYLINL